MLTPKDNDKLLEALREFAEKVEKYTMSSGQEDNTVTLRITARKGHVTGKGVEINGAW